MPFILENWNALLNTILHPGNEHLLLLTDESLNVFMEQSKEGQEKVRALFLQGILERPKVRDKKQYVKLNQAMLIRLLDKIYSYKQEKKLNDKIMNLYDTICHQLESTLDFIEDFFGNYFDRNEKVPMTYLINSIRELSRQLELLKHAIIPGEPYVHAILNILINNFNNFFERKNGATYNELLYQKYLMNQLLTGNALADENSIREVLFYFNYNDDNYLAYLFEKLNALTGSLPGNNEKIAALRFEQKKMNQLPTRLNCSLSSTMPSLKEQVNHWIEEEIKFLEIDSALVADPPGGKAKVYIHVPFRGPEIYLLHKSFIDSNGAPGETYKSLFEKTGAHLTNKNQKGFSPESLQKASDKVDYEAKENVKRFLQKMIRNIDSY